MDLLRTGLLALLATTTPAAAQACGGFRVLVFSKTAGYRHAVQIPFGIALVRSLGATSGFAVDATEDARVFERANLARYATVVFLYTTGDVLEAEQEAAFEDYMRDGGGFVGVHSAADTEYAWPFYGSVVGAWFASHPAVQDAEVDVVDATHESTAHLPPRFTHNDEWYDYRTNPASNPELTVLMTLDESTYTGGQMGAVHPIAWYRDVPGVGRSWYTGFGHTTATLSAPFFVEHLRGGIMFTSRQARTLNATASTYGQGGGPWPLQLTAMPQPPHLVLELGAGQPQTIGALFLSTCDAAQPFSSLTLLVDFSPPAFVGSFPVVFDGTGFARLALPAQPTLPARLGTRLFFQGAHLAGGGGASNGVEVALAP